MRPAGNDNKGAMKLRVDFKKKHTGDFPLLMLMQVLMNAACIPYSKVNPFITKLMR